MGMGEVAVQNHLVLISGELYSGAIRGSLVELKELNNVFNDA